MTDSATFVEEWVEATDVSKYSQIVCIGGDGLVNQLLNSLNFKGSLKSQIGVVPAGTTNALACALGCKNVNTAIFYILKGFKLESDLIHVKLDNSQEILASCALAWGIVSQIAVDAQNLRAFGTAVSYRQRYTISGIKKFVCPKEDYTATIFLYDRDDQVEVIEGPFMLAVAANHPCPSTQSSDVIAPRADINDGLIDTIVVKDINKLQLLKFLTKMRDGGKHVDMSCVSNRKATRLKIVSDIHMPVNIDGEVYYSSYIDAKVLPGVVTFTGVKESVGFETDLSTE